MQAQEMELAILPDDCEREKWNEIVTSFGDHNFYQSWEWGEAKRVQGWTPLRMVCTLNGDIIGAAQGFKKSLLPRGWGVLWIPGGPLVLKDGENLSAIGNLESVVGAIQRRFSEERLVIRCAPYLFSTSQAVGTLNRLGFKRLERAAFRYTFLLDLTQPLDVLRARMKKKWRQKLNRFSRSGVEIRHNNSEQEISDFYTIVKMTEETKKFRYGIKLRQLRIFAQFYGNVRFLLAYHSDRPIGGLMVAFLGEKGIELFAGYTPEGYQLGVSYGLRWEAIQWLKSLQVRLYDLGGVDPVKGEGVYYFKSGFGGDLAEFLGEWEYSPNWIMSIGLHLLEKLR
jgi:lipid II:glycine glycyltransferase (peptidoglycan interpeptide bridge formation enzyme)